MARLLSLTTAVIIVCATWPARAQAPAGAGAVQGTSARTITRTATGRLLPGTRADVFTTIQGNALSSTNGQLADAPVRLRDARFGRIVDTQITDKSGLFAFRAVDPGSYIVEIMGTDQSTVLAASQILSVDAGQAISAVVKLPLRLSPLAGLLGDTVPSAAAVTTEAAASSVLAATVVGQPTCAIGGGRGAGINGIR